MQKFILSNERSFARDLISEINFFLMRYPSSLTSLMQFFKKLPGVGSKTSERFAFHILDWDKSELEQFAHMLQTIQEKLKTCEECGALKQEEKCFFCQTPGRDQEILCVLATPKDIFAVEHTGEYQGLYHVLGGTLSPLESRNPKDLSFGKLRERILRLRVKEVILALDATLEGDATALFLKQELMHFPVSVSRLAFGIPMGSSLDYIDGGTLARAFIGRGSF